MEYGTLPTALFAISLTAVPILYLVSKKITLRHKLLQQVARKNIASAL